MQQVSNRFTILQLPLFLFERTSFIIISQTRGRKRFQSCFGTQHSEHHYWKVSPRERWGDGEREGKERARGRERERDWEGESSGEDGSPLRNDGIAVKLAQAEGSDYTHTLAEETRDPSAKLRGVGRKRRAGKWLWQRCNNFSCSTCCGSAELGAQQVGERSALFSNSPQDKRRMTRDDD